MDWHSSRRDTVPLLPLPRWPIALFLLFAFCPSGDCVSAARSGVSWGKRTISPRAISARRAAKARESPHGRESDARARQRRIDDEAHHRRGILRGLRKRRASAGQRRCGSAGAQTWRAAGLLHRQLRRDPSVLPRWQHRAARDLRHGERCGHFRRPPALSELRFHP